MKIETCQLFAQLLEGFIIESSSAMSVLAKHPGGPEVVKHLHRSMSLAHDLNYTPIDKISWSDIKGRSSGAWVLIQADNGTGAIRARNDTYDAVASVGDEVKTFTNSKGGNILDFLRGVTGKPRKFYVSKPGADRVRILQRQRANYKKGADVAAVNNDTIVTKFKPLWVRAMTAALADIKGHIANMIKNDAYTKAKKKLDYLERLQNSLEELESGSDNPPEQVRRAVSIAVLMAASHHYPEQTGNIQSTRWGDGYEAQYSEGQRMLLKDISNGDQKKLGTVLGFFKRALISG